MVDWWKPLTISHTRVGVEDFIIGFAIGGVASVIYEELYKRRLSKKKIKPFGNYNAFVFLFGFAICYLSLFYIFKFSSFYSSAISYLMFTVWILFKRIDLLKDSIYSGLWMLVIGIGIYFLLFLIYPDFIQQFWFLPRQWYANLFFGIPIAEYIWYFFTGAFIGPLYEFIKQSKMVRN